jgi:hypothetical protein
MAKSIVSIAALSASSTSHFSISTKCNGTSALTQSDSGGSIIMNHGAGVDVISTLAQNDRRNFTAAGMARISLASNGSENPPKRNPPVSQAAKPLA